MQDIITKGSIIILGVLGIVAPPALKESSDTVPNPQVEISSLSVQIRNVKTQQSVGVVAVNSNEQSTQFIFQNAKGIEVQKLVLYEGTCSNLGTIQYVLDAENAEIRDSIKDIVAGPPLALVIETSPMEQNYCGEITYSPSIVNGSYE